jgi:cytochrome c
MQSLSRAALGLLAFGAALPSVAANAQDVARGKALFKTCHACHSIEQDGETMLGPDLWGVYGAKAASKPDFAYSAALRNAGIVWNEDTLSRWLAGPAKFLPGNKMAFPGLPDEDDRKAVIAYLKSNAD